MSQAMQLAGSQPTVSLGEVLGALAERLQSRFTALVQDLPQQTAENRPTPLLQFLHDARQQLLRAAALLHDTRKLPPLTLLVQPGGVLDLAATHARALQTTADSLFETNGLLCFNRVQLFNVPDALDVLSTGTYSNLPAAIQDMRGPMPAQEQEQQRLLNQLNHLLYAHLLKAHLPEALQLVEVTGGYAVLRCPGLYEVQLSLQQLPYPVQVAEARQAAKEAAEAAVLAAAGSGEAGQAGTTTQQLQEQQAAQQQQQQQQQQSDASAAAGAAAPEVRWQWKLTHLVVLPNAGNRQLLQPEQLLSLTHHLQANMWAAADAAAVEAAKQQGAAEGGQPQAPAAAAAAGAAGKGATAAAAAQPAASGMLSTRSGPAASTLSGLSGLQGDAAGRGLQLDLYRSDEISLPLRLMHAVLRDVAARILLREVEAAAGQLAGAGSKWHTHLRLVKPETLKPGLCLLYWQQAPALLALPDPAAEAAAEGGAADGAAAAAAAAAANKPGQAGKAADAYPAIEVGTGSDGTIQQLHVPPLRLPGSQQQQQQLLLRPSLDTHTVDIVGLLLQGVQVLVANQLMYLHDSMQRRRQQEAAEGKGQQEADAMLQLRLARYGHLRSSAAAQQQQQQQQQGRQLVARSASPSAAAAAAGGVPDAFSEEQQHQAALLQQLPDTLEVLVEGQAAVTISFQPWSGRLILRPGSAYGGDCNIEFGMSLHQHQEALRSRQDRLYQQLQQQLQGRSSSSSSAPVSVEQHQQAVVLPCMRDLATGLLDFCDELLLKQQYTHLVTAARMLSLQHSHHLRAFLSAGQQQQQQLLRVPQPAAAGAGAGRARSGRGVRQIYLSMPSLQLPPYMLLLAAGPWCGGGAADTQQQGQKQQRQQQQQEGAGLPRAAAAAGQRQVAARLATLNPVLCMSFPRQQASNNTDGLLLVLCNAQGLPGPLLKELRLPSSRVQEAGGLQAAAAAGPVGSSSRKKRQRDEFEEESQQQQLLQAQQLKTQQEGCQQQLAAVVEHSRARLTYERILLELTALQVCFQEVLPLSAASRQQGSGRSSSPQQQQKAWVAPSIRLVSVPGVQLFQQLERPQGCSPAAVGLQEAWILAGPAPGEWCLELAGRLYCQQQQCAVLGAEAAQGGGWCWRYDLAAGGDVRVALLQLQRVLHMQQFLNRLECLAVGRQQLEVLSCSSTSVGSTAAAVDGGGACHLPDRPIKKARHSSSSGGGGGGGAAAADGLANGGMSAKLLSNGMLPAGAANSGRFGGHSSSNGQQLGPNGLRMPAASSNGNSHPAVAGKAAVAAGHGSSSDASVGLLWDWPGTGLVRLAGYSCSEAVLQCNRPLQDDPSAAVAAVDGAAGAVAAGSSAAPGIAPPQQVRPPSKVQFHVSWQPLYGFGPSPAKPQPATTTAAQQQGSVQPSVGCESLSGLAGAGGSSSSGARRWPSSSNTTDWVDVHATQQQQQQQQAGGGGGVGAPAPAAAAPHVMSARDVLAMGCCVSCSSSSVPQALLSELSAMADAGCEDLLLDAVALLGWPLSQLQLLLSEAAPARVGALLSKASKKVPGGTAAAGDGWWPSVVVSCPAGSCRQLRVTVSAEAAGAPAPPRQQPQQQQQQQQQQSEGEAGKGADSGAPGGLRVAAQFVLPPGASFTQTIRVTPDGDMVGGHSVVADSSGQELWSSADGTPGFATPRLRYQLLLDVCVASGGRAKVTVRQVKAGVSARDRALQAAAAAVDARDTATAAGTSGGSAREAAAAAAAAAVPEYASSIILAALQHLRKALPQVGCIPAFGAATWQRQVVPQLQGAAAAAAGGDVQGFRRDPLSGFWLPVGDLQPVLSILLECWAHHVIKTAVAAAAATAAGQARVTAAAAAPAAGAAPGSVGQPAGAATASAASAGTAAPAGSSAATPPGAGQQQQPAGSTQGQVKPEQPPQQQQQQVRPQMPQVSQGPVYTQQVHMPAPGLPPAVVCPPAMPPAMPPPAPPMTGVQRPAAAAAAVAGSLALQQQQQQPMMLPVMSGGVLPYPPPMMAPGVAGMVQPTAWNMPMHGVPQQQLQQQQHHHHPAQQQQHRQ